MALRLAIVGTGTEVGKTTVTALLVRGLRQHGRLVWMHKPMACGGWDGASADDGRRLRALVGDGQPVESICPLEYPEAASPHLAAAAAGISVDAATLTANFQRCHQDAPGDLIVEGAGGLFTPLTADRRSLADLLPQWGLPAVLVTRPDLGTLHATSATVRAAAAAGVRVIGLVLNEPTDAGDSLAVRTASDELHAITGLAVLSWIRHGGDQDPTDAILAATHEPAAPRPR